MRSLFQHICQMQRRMLEKQSACACTLMKHVDPYDRKQHFRPPRRGLKAVENDEKCQKIPRCLINQNPATGPPKTASKPRIPETRQNTKSVSYITHSVPGVSLVLCSVRLTLGFCVILAFYMFYAYYLLIIVYADAINKQTPATSCVIDRTTQPTDAVLVAFAELFKAEWKAGWLDWVQLGVCR